MHSLPAPCGTECFFKGDLRMGTAAQRGQGGGFAVSEEMLWC